jgi:peptide/nickel transport system substrate-binding protein
MSSLGPKSAWSLCPPVFMCGTPWESREAEEFHNQNNIARSKELLAEVGYNGETITLLNPTDYGTITPLGPVLKASLEAAGFNIDMPANDWATIISKFRDRDAWHMFTNWGTISSRGSPAFNVNITGEPTRGYESPAMFALHKQFVGSVDTAEKLRVAGKMQAVYYDEVPNIVLGILFMPSPYRTYVKNAPAEHQSYNVYFNLWLDK